MEEEDDAPPEGAPAWMATFADMSTLLLTFFVLLLSFANMDIVEFRMALGSVKDALGVKTQNPGNFEGVTTQPVPWPDVETHDGSVGVGDQSIVQVARVLETLDAKERVEVKVDEHNIRVRLYDLFDPGSGGLQPRSFEDLDMVAQVAGFYPHPVRVEGHTDDRRIRTAAYPSNWELSAARAGVVARYLVEAGRVSGYRMTAGGVAHYKNEHPNDVEDNRAKNRFVEVVIAKQKVVPAQVTNNGMW